MSTLVNFNSTGYLVPTVGETGWGATLTALLVDMGANTVTRSGALISSGAINASIGATTPSTGVFTSLTATSLTLTSGLNSTPIGSTSASTGLFTTLGMSSSIAHTGAVANWQSRLTGGSTDQNNSDMTVNAASGQINFRLLNDAYSQANVWLNVTRTGYVPNAITLTASSLVLNGAVNISNSITVPTRAPSDNTTNAASTAFVATATASVTSDYGRNKLLNPMLAFNQMNPVGTVVGGANSTVWVNDGWLVSSSGNSAATAAVAALVDADRAALGDEEAVNCLSCGISGAIVGATDYGLFSHRIEGVRKFSGKTCTLSFWALASAAGQKLAVEVSQVFGTGGSPSATITGQNVTTFNLTQTWTRYSMTFTFASSAGKTFGTTANTDMHIINFWMTGGSSYNTRNNTLGSQVWTCNFWGAQLEFGSTVTPLDKRPIAHEALLCKRYYETGVCVAGAPTGAAGGAYAPVFYFEGKSTVPIITLANNSFSNVTSTAAQSVGQTGFYYLANVTGAGAFSASNTWVADARP